MAEPQALPVANVQPAAVARVEKPLPAARQRGAVKRGLQALSTALREQENALQSRYRDGVAPGGAAVAAPAAPVAAAAGAAPVPEVPNGEDVEMEDAVDDGAEAAAAAAEPAVPPPPPPPAPPPPAPLSTDREMMIADRTVFVAKALHETSELLQAHPKGWTPTKMGLRLAEVVSDRTEKTLNAGSLQGHAARTGIDRMTLARGQTVYLGGAYLIWWHNMRRSIIQLCEDVEDRGGRCLTLFIVKSADETPLKCVIIDSELLFGLPDRFFLRLRAQEFRRHQTLRHEIRHRKRRHT